MPIAAETKGGVLEGKGIFTQMNSLSQLIFFVGENNSAMYREDIARCNLNLIPIMNEKKWDVLDANFWFRNCQDQFRENDGIHWTAHAHRWLTNIFLSHLAEAWGLGWPTYPIKDPSKNTIAAKKFKGVPLEDIFTFDDETRKIRETRGPDDILCAEQLRPLN